MYINVDIEEWEVLPQISDKTLLNEVNERGLNSVFNHSKENLILLDKIYQEQRDSGTPSQAMKDFIFNVLGKVL